MSKFQIIFVGVLIAIAVVALLIFTGALPGFNQKKGENALAMSMWGPFSDQNTKTVFSKFNEDNSDFFSVSYSEKQPENYEKELLNAMAAGNPPEVWFLRQDMVLQYKDKIQITSFDSFPERDFKDFFAEAGELFLDKNNDGIIAFPFVVDPVVLYWNRDLFSSAGISRPPEYWDEFLTDAAALTKTNESGDIIQAGAALGEFRNVRNAKDILSMMILQTGNPVLDNEKLQVVWNERKNSALGPAESSLRFFGDFSNPKKTSYSWNRALDNSSSLFSSGSLAMYFGYASEFNKIKEKNPHLNFDVSVVPQIKDGFVKATFGRVYSLAISKMSPNRQAALPAVFKLLSGDFNKLFADGLFLAPASRDVLKAGSKDPALSVFYKSAVMARSWLEPEPAAVSVIFQNMVESTVTGKQTISEAVSDAKEQLENLLR
jgi:multiple sugar transport system substrate-binding protein